MTSVAREGNDHIKNNVEIEYFVVQNSSSVGESVEDNSGFLSAECTDPLMYFYEPGEPTMNEAGNDSALAADPSTGDEEGSDVHQTLLTDNTRSESVLDDSIENLDRGFSEFNIPNPDVPLPEEVTLIVSQSDATIDKHDDLLDESRRKDGNLETTPDDQIKLGEGMVISMASGNDDLCYRRRDISPSRPISSMVGNPGSSSDMPSRIINLYNETCSNPLYDLGGPCVAEWNPNDYSSRNTNFQASPNSDMNDACCYDGVPHYAVTASDYDCTGEPLYDYDSFYHYPPYFSSNAYGYSYLFRQLSPYFFPCYALSPWPVHVAVPLSPQPRPPAPTRSPVYPCCPVSSVSNAPPADSSHNNSVADDLDQNPPDDPPKCESNALPDITTGIINEPAESPRDVDASAEEYPQYSLPCDSNNFMDDSDDHYVPVNNEEYENYFYSYDDYSDSEVSSLDQSDNDSIDIPDVIESSDIADMSAASLPGELPSMKNPSCSYERIGAGFSSDQIDTSAGSVSSGTLHVADDPIPGFAMIPEMQYAGSSSHFNSDINNSELFFDNSALDHFPNEGTSYNTFRLPSTSSLSEVLFGVPDSSLRDPRFLEDPAIANIPLETSTYWRPLTIGPLTSYRQVLVFCSVCCETMRLGSCPDCGALMPMHWCYCNSDRCHSCNLKFIILSRCRDDEYEFYDDFDDESDVGAGYSHQMTESVPDAPSPPVSPLPSESPPPVSANTAANHSPINFGQIACNYSFTKTTCCCGEFCGGYLPFP